MAQDGAAMENLKWITDMQQFEVKQYWSRNSHFLVASGILLLAASQFPSGLVRFSIGLVGLFLNIAWLMTQRRSYQLVLHWKVETQKLVEVVGITNSANVKGFEGGVISYLMTLPFFWLWFIVLLT